MTTPTTAHNANTAHSVAESAIRQANTNENRWMVEARVDRLEELLDDSFVLVHIDGYPQPKVDWLDEIRSGSMNYHSIREQSVLVTVDGATAVLVAKNLVSATIWGSKALWPLQMTTTFRQSDGVWKPTHSRATTF